jgi:hypothetical protein
VLDGGGDVDIMSMYLMQDGDMNLLDQKVFNDLFLMI